MTNTSRNILIGLAVIVAAGLIIYFVGRSKAPEVPNTGASETSSSTASWLNFSDDARGVAFDYPENLPTKYIQAVDWPPQVAVGNGPYTCTEAGNLGDRAGRTEERTINGHTYCVTQVREGAAGSIYDQYAYATMTNDKFVILTFSIRSPQCANYEEPKRSECQSEEDSFDLDGLVDRMVGTLHLSAPTLEYEKG